jgi:legumain
MFHTLSLLLGSLLWTSCQAEQWAVLVAGSNGFWNYRHQTDVAHAYQILHKNGVPDSNIITMVYDDIASDPSNPYPGQLFNKPTATGVDGWDVYKGFKKSYTGNEVSATNFLNVITGNSSAMNGTGSGEVLRSTEKDNVFIYYTDHGASGIVCMPDGSLLYSDQLNSALVQMYNQRMYKQLTFYMEACESGSMFDGLLAPNISVYATTAADPTESSWGWYCPGGAGAGDPGDSVNGVDIGSCLGDLYSINWMENSDPPGAMKETLQEQYLVVLNETTMSHVMQYGDLSFVGESIGTFMSQQNQSVSYFPSFKHKKHVRHHSSRASHVNSLSLSLSDDVYSWIDLLPYNSYNNKLKTLYTRWCRSCLLSDLSAVEEELASRVYWDNAFSAVRGRFYMNRAHLNPATMDWNCYRNLNAAVQNEFGHYSDYALQYVHWLAGYCSSLQPVSYVLW